jgi:hypothetical protein
MGGKKSDVRVVHGVRLQHLQRPSDERDGVLDAIRRVQQRDLLVSDIKVGDVQVAQGDLAGALKSYRDGLAIADRPAKSDPGNAVRQRDLSASHSKIADVLRRAGKTTEALDALRRGHAIMARLTSLSPENARWKRDLAWFAGQIADLSS